MSVQLLLLQCRSVNFSQGVMLTTPFTLGVYMVRDFLQKQHPGQPVDERAVGQLTGLLVSCLAWSRTLKQYACMAARTRHWHDLAGLQAALVVIGRAMCLACVKLWQVHAGLPIPKDFAQKVKNRRQTCMALCCLAVVGMCS